MKHNPKCVCCQEKDKHIEKLETKLEKFQNVFDEISTWEKLVYGGNIRQEYEIENGKGSWPKGINL